MISLKSEIRSMLKMKINFHDNLHNGAVNLCIGYAIIEDVNIIKSSSELDKEIESVISEAKSHYGSSQNMYSAQHIDLMRKILKNKGIDPKRYRMSAESLLKRVLDSQPLYRINGVVDVNNLGSIKFALPMGVYDMANLSGDITFKFGEPGETMETMAKGKMNMENFLLSKDELKLFGSPVSDSPYAKITNQSRKILLLVYGLREFNEENIIEATKFTASKIIHYNSGKIAEVGIKIA